MKPHSQTPTFNTEKRSQKVTHSKAKMSRLTQLTLIPIKRAKESKPGILPERFAIVTCGLLIALFAIPLLVVIQVLAALFWGITSVVKLLKGEGLFDDENGL